MQGEYDRKSIEEKKPGENRAMTCSMKSYYLKLCYLKLCYLKLS